MSQKSKPREKIDLTDAFVEGHITTQEFLRHKENLNNSRRAGTKKAHVNQTMIVSQTSKRKLT